MTVHTSLIKEFKNRQLRALSRFITLAENKHELVCTLLNDVYGTAGKASIIGITGPPGAGKSTLINFFVKMIRESEKTVAVIAVDPVSPFSGGALLGDRIRLTEHFKDPGVFIRSLSTRGKLGGLSLATREVVNIADCFGFDYILIETVGVGQSEVDVRKIADATLLVLVPEWGDAIQTMKAGILEIGDIFVINKSDREGADRLKTDLEASLQIAHRAQAPVVTTHHQSESSIRKLFAIITQFLETQEDIISERRKLAVRETINELLESIAIEEARRWVKENIKEEKNPYEFILRFLKAHPPESFFEK